MTEREIALGRDVVVRAKRSTRSDRARFSLVLYPTDQIKLVAWSWTLRISSQVSQVSPKVYLQHRNNIFLVSIPLYIALDVNRDECLFSYFGLLAWQCEKIRSEAEARQC